MNRLGKSFAATGAVEMISLGTLRFAVKSVEMDRNEQIGVEVVGGVTNTLQAVMLEKF